MDKPLPTVIIKVNDKNCIGLVDTGCSTTMVKEDFVTTMDKSQSCVTAFDGSKVMCKGLSLIHI